MKHFGIGWREQYTHVKHINCTVQLVETGTENSTIFKKLHVLPNSFPKCVSNFLHPSETTFHLYSFALQLKIYDLVCIESKTSQLKILL